MDKLEKIYKDKLTTYDSPVSDAVWENVAASLIEDKKKYRFYILLFFIGLILAGLIGGSLLYKNNKTKKSSEFNFENANVAQNEATNNKYEVSNNLLSSNPTLNADHNNINNDLSTINDNSENLKYKKNKSLLTDEANTKLENIGQESIKRNIIESNTNYNNPDKSFNITKSYNSVNSNNFINILESTNGNIENNNENKNSQASLNTVFTREKFNTSYLKSDKTNKINYIFSSQRQRLDHKSIVNSKYFQDGILNDCFPRKINSWLLEVYLSPDYADKSLQGNNTSYLNSRLNTEDPILSFSSGVRVGYLFNNGVVLKSGLNYSSINERFHIVIENVISTQTVITIDTIRHNDGTYTIQRDTTINEKLGIEDIQKMTSYKMLGIPLIAGFEFRRWNHNFGINTGVIFNLITYQKGYMLNSKGDIEQFGNEDNKIFQNNLGISFYASLFYSYRFNANYELFVEPKVRYYLKSFTLSNYPLEQKYTKYGISFGGRYIF